MRHVIMEQNVHWQLLVWDHDIVVCGAAVVTDLTIKILDIFFVMLFIICIRCHGQNYLIFLVLLIFEMMHVSILCCAV